MASATPVAADADRPVVAGARTEGEIRRTWQLFAILFGVVNGTCMLPNSVASSLMDPKMADLGLSAQFAVAICTSLFAASPIMGQLGIRGATVTGFFVRTLGFFLFYLSLHGISHDWSYYPELITWTAACIIAGVGFTIVWSVQGALMGATAAKLSEATGLPINQCTTQVAMVSATTNLFIEIFARFGFSLLQIAFSIDTVACMYALANLVASLILAYIKNLNPDTSPPVRKTVMEGVKGVMSVWNDPNIWLLSPLMLTFGFASAFLNGYISGVFVKSELGERWVAMVSSVVSIAGTCWSFLFGYLGQWFGKGPVVLLGAMGIFYNPFSQMVLGCCNGWGIFLISIYVFHGAGRATYESTGRAAFADFFPAPYTQNAFANCALQVNVAMACSFLFQTFLNRMGMATVVAVLAISQPTLYYVACCIGPKTKKKA